MSIYLVSSYSRVGDGTKEYRFYFSCFRKASLFVDYEHFEEFDDHGAIFRMDSGVDGQFQVKECLRTW